MKSYFPQLKRGVAYYQKPSSEAEKRLKASNKVKGKKLTLVLDISGHLVWCGGGAWLAYVDIV